MTLVGRSASYDRGITTEPHIGTLNEGSLHAALKADYAEPGDVFEVPLDGFVIDIRRDDRLIEIQTSSFASMGSKLDHLLSDHRMLLVHPIAVETYLQKPDAPLRKSPKKGSVYDLFEELVSMPTLIEHPNLEIDVALVTVVKHQSPDAKLRRGRGGFRTDDRVLREIVERRRFACTADLMALVPDGLPDVFTTADLAGRAGVRRDVAQRMAYCFRALGTFVEQGRTKAGIGYTLG
ncbi:MAG: hypothetical protein DHS20C19_10980 [Acidimicrobiales bacterium]|nr:MAG: hypothetical protein DHS20C19_10980 [Acidimicrobiales bacterium]